MTEKAIYIAILVTKLQCVWISYRHLVSIFYSNWSGRLTLVLFFRAIVNTYSWRYILLCPLLFASNAIAYIRTVYWFLYKGHLKTQRSLKSSLIFNQTIVKYNLYEDVISECSNKKHTCKYVGCIVYRLVVATALKNEPQKICVKCPVTKRGLIGFVIIPQATPQMNSTCICLDIIINNWI